MRGFRRPYSWMIQEAEAHNMNVKVNIMAAWIMADALSASGSVMLAPPSGDERARSGDMDVNVSITVVRMLVMARLTLAHLTPFFSLAKSGLALVLTILR